MPVSVFKDSEHVFHHVNEQAIDEIASAVSEKIVNETFFKLMILKYLPEVQAIKEGKIKALRGKEIDEFYKKLIKSKSK